MEKETELKAIATEIKTQVYILGTLVAIMWIEEIIDVFIFKGGLNQFGILPRHPIGLRGIIFAPFLHGGFAHLIGNTIPFLILGWLVMLKETKDFITVSIIAMLTAGLGTWLFGRYSYHIGASGVIFGYFGYLLARGWFEKKFLSLMLSVTVAIFWGRLIFGVLPTSYGISWEGHLFGFIGGIIAAKMLAHK
jgi:membrane associated rhomboid family serine protease